MNNINQFQLPVPPVRIDLPQPIARTPLPTVPTQEGLPHTPETLRSFLQSKAENSTEKFDKISQNVAQELEKLCPDEFNKLTQLKIKHKDMLVQLQEAGGWARLKKQLGDKMKVESKGMSFEKLREEMVKATTDLSEAAVKKLGYPVVGTFNSVGTTGYNSDKDMTFNFHKDVSQEDQVYIKFGIDCVINNLFIDLPGGKSVGLLPGCAFDTEIYIGQGKDPYVIEKDMRSEKGKKTYQYIDHVIALTQVYDGIVAQCHSPEEAKASWDAYVQKRLAKAGAISVEYQKTLTSAFKDVKNLKDQITLGIEERVVQDYSLEKPNISKGSKGYEEEIHRLAEKVRDENPENYRKGAVSYKSNALVGLSRAMDNDLRQETSLREQIARQKIGNQSRFKNLGSFFTTDKALKQHPASKGSANGISQKDQVKTETGDSLEQGLEKVRLEFYQKACLRNMCFDEGFIGIGAFFTVVSKEGGQSSARKLEEVQKKVNTLEINQLARAGLNLEGDQLKASTLADFLGSLTENLGFFFNHFSHDQKDKTLDSKLDSFVKNSKYADRVYVACGKIIGQIKKSEKYQSDPKFKSRIDFLERRVKKFAFIASELEKCKRQIELSETAGAKLLENAIEGQLDKMIKEKIDEGISRLSKLKPNAKKEKEKITKEIKELLEKRVQIKESKEIQNQLKNFCKTTAKTFRTKEDKFESDIDKSTVSIEERYNTFVTKIKYFIISSNIAGNTKKVQLSENIDNITKAMAGYPKFTKEGVYNNKIADLLKEGEKVTLAGLGLDNEAEISFFNKEMADVAEDTIDSVLGYMPNSPSNDLKVDNIGDTWQIIFPAKNLTNPTTQEAQV